MTAIPKGQGAVERDSLEVLIARYRNDHSPVEVNFRNLRTADNDCLRHAHTIHPYPAKLLVNIPQFFLSALSPPVGSVILDPFCGSGTVLYEGALYGLHPVGSDSNPLARLIAKAKLTPINSEAALVQLSEVLSAYVRVTPTIPDVVNRQYWFSDRISESLGRLRTAIVEHVPDQHRALFDVSFSVTVRRVSYADPRLSVPVKINRARSARYGAKGDEVIRRLDRLENVDVAAIFWSITTQNIRRCSVVSAKVSSVPPLIFDDARSIGVADETVDIAITSPPYVGAQKYIRASSLSLGWLGLTPGCHLRSIERQSIGREHLSAAEEFDRDGTGLADADEMLVRIAERNKLRARIAQRYLIEMRAALHELARTMRDGALLVLIVGPNMVAGLNFPTPSYIERLAIAVGFETQLHLVDSIDSRGLMTKRNRTAGVIQQESVLLLRRSRASA